MEKLAAEGIDVDVLTLDGGDFESLTISKQLKVVEQAADCKDTVLIGSSMGGYLAALYAARHENVRGMVLLAPAFDFAGLWRQRMGEETFKHWQQQGTVPVFHYGLGRETALRFDLMPDAEKYEARPRFAAPALIFHGNQDDVVPVESSVEFVRQHPNAELMRLEAGHELTEVLEPLWKRAWPFLQSALTQF